MLKKLALVIMLIAPMSIFAQKFGYFKSEAIIPVMPEYAKAQNDIEALRKQYEDEIKRASDEFSKKFAAFQKEQKSLPQNILERRQKELQDLQEKAMQFQQDAQQQLEKSYRDMMIPVYEKMEKAVKTVAKAGGFLMVFDMNRTDIPYIDEAQVKDVTNDIKTNMGISLTAAPYVPQTPAPAAPVAPVK